MSDATRGMTTTVHVRVSVRGLLIAPSTGIPPAHTPGHLLLKLASLVLPVLGIFAHLVGIHLILAESAQTSVTKELSRDEIGESMYLGRWFGSGWLRTKQVLRQWQASRYTRVRCRTYRPVHKYWRWGWGHRWSRGRERRRTKTGSIGVLPLSVCCSACKRDEPLHSHISSTR